MPSALSREPDARSTCVGVLAAGTAMNSLLAEESSRCGELITSGAQLDYIADIDWDYVRIATLSC